MVVVALAGASSGLGLVIITELLKAKNHTIIALSRNPSPKLTELGAEVRVVGDYSDHAVLVNALKGVDTVIVTLSTMDPNVWQSSQINLLNAAKEAGCRRFAPSEWAVSNYEGVKLYAPKVPVWKACVESGLEYARFSCGIFMNICGTGTPKGEEEALGGLRPWKFMIDVENGTADIAGDGSELITLTETHDVGRFVNAALSLEKWPAEIGMAGETLPLMEVIRKAEQVTGRKFLVKTNTKEDLAEQVRQNPSTEFYNDARSLLFDNRCVVPPYLNEQFPEIKPITVSGYLEKWWGGVSLPEPHWTAPKLFGKDNMNEGSK